MWMCIRRARLAEMRRHNGVTEWTGKLAARKNGILCVRFTDISGQMLCFDPFVRTSLSGLHWMTAIARPNLLANVTASRWLIPPHFSSHWSAICRHCAPWILSHSRWPIAAWCPVLFLAEYMCVCARALHSRLIGVREFIYVIQKLFSMRHTTVQNMRVRSVSRSRSLERAFYFHFQRWAKRRNSPYLATWTDRKS